MDIEQVRMVAAEANKVNAARAEAEAVKRNAHMEVCTGPFMNRVNEKIMTSANIGDMFTFFEINADSKDVAAPPGCDRRAILGGIARKLTSAGYYVREDTDWLLINWRK